MVHRPLGCKVTRVAVGAGVANHAGKRGRNMIRRLALYHRRPRGSISGRQVAVFTGQGVSVRGMLRRLHRPVGGCKTANSPRRRKSIVMACFTRKRSRQMVCRFAQQPRVRSSMASRAPRTDAAVIHGRPQEAGGILVAGIASGVNRCPGNTSISRNMSSRRPVRSRLGLPIQCATDCAAVVARSSALTRCCSDMGTAGKHLEATGGKNAPDVA